MDLRNGGGRQRLLVDAGEDLGQRSAELGLDRARDDRPRRRRDVGLQLGQLARERRADEVRTGGQHLAELDERDPAVGHRLPDRPGHAGVGLAGGDAASAAQVSAEAVLRRDGDDPRIPAAPAPPRRQASQPGDRPGKGAGGDDRLEDDQDRQPQGDGPGQAQEDEEQGLDGVDLGGQVTAAGLDVQLDARDPADELDDAAERPRHEQADDDGARPPHRHAEQPA